MVKQIGCLHLLQSYEFKGFVKVGKRCIHRGYSSYLCFLGDKILFFLPCGGCFVVDFCFLCICLLG